MKHSLTILVQTVNSANAREHWSDKAKRSKVEKLRTLVAWKKAKLKLPALLKIHLTRIGPKEMDSDGVVTSLKAIQDQIAKCLRIDDGSPLVKWEYSQQLGQYAVEVEIETI